MQLSIWHASRLCWNMGRVLCRVGCGLQACLLIYYALIAAAQASELASQLQDICYEVCTEYYCHYLEGLVSSWQVLCFFLCLSFASARLPCNNCSRRTCCGRWCAVIA